MPPVKYVLTNTELADDLYLATVYMLPEEEELPIRIAATVGTYEHIQERIEVWGLNLCTVFFADTSGISWDIEGFDIYAPENTTMMQSITASRVRLEVLAWPSQLTGGMIHAVLRLATEDGTALILDHRDVPNWDAMRRQMQRWEREYSLGGLVFNRNVQGTLPPIATHHLFFTPFSLREDA